MTCEHNRDLCAWHDGQLGGADRERFAEHLAGCPTCQAELRELQRLSRLVRSGQRMAIPLGLIARVHERVNTLGERSILRIAELLTAAAAIILATGLAFLAEGGRQAPRRPVASSPPVVFDYGIPEEMSVADASTRESLELAQFVEGRIVTEQQP